MLPYLICAYLLAINLVAFVLFGADKSRAARGAWRIRESTLIETALVGGSIGALVGMRVFHHKTRKPLFSYGIPLILIAQVALLGFLFARGVL